MIELIRQYFQEYTAAAIVQCITVPIYGASFAVKNKLRLVLVVVSCALFAVGYALMSAWSGVIVSITVTAACVLAGLATQKEKAKKNTNLFRLIVFISVIIINFICNLIFDNSALSYLVIVGNSINSFCWLVLKDSRTKKEWALKQGLFVVAHALIITFEILTLLYLFAVLDTVALLVALITLMIYFIKILRDFANKKFAVLRTGDNFIGYIANVPEDKNENSEKEEIFKKEELQKKDDDLTKS